MLCNWIDKNVYTQKELQRRYSISSKNLRRWLIKFRGEGNQLHGRFKKINDVKKGEIVIAVEESARDHMHLSEEIVDGMLEVAAYVNSIESGKLNEDVKKMGLSKTTKWRIKKQLSLKARATNDSTLARLAACKDPFPSVAWAAINWGVASRLSADCKANADATTIFMHTDKKNNKGMIYCTSEEGEKCKQKFIDDSGYDVTSHKNHSNRKKHSGINEYFKKSSLGTGVKYIQLSFANGRSGPATLVFALDSIPVDRFERFFLPRFTTPNSLSSPAVVYFCKLRNGNSALYEDWFRNVAIPALIDERNHWKKSDNLDNVQPMFFSMDSEAVVMNQAKSEEVNNLFRDNEISFAKLSAGTTAIHQACDRSSLFHSMKSTIRSKNFGEKATVDPTFEKEMEIMFETLRDNGMTITQRERTDVRYVIVILKHAIQQVMTPQCIKDGFSVCGQHVTSMGTSFTVCIRKILEQCYTDYSEEDFVKLEAIVKDLSEIILTKGKLCYQDMVDAGVPVNTFTVNRDGKPIANRWVELITHESVQAEFRLEEERKRKREEEKDPHFTALQREIKKAKRLIENSEKEEQRILKKTRQREEALANRLVKKKQKDMSNREKAYERREKNKSKALKEAEKKINEANKKRKLENKTTAVNAAKELLMSVRT